MNQKDISNYDEFNDDLEEKLRKQRKTKKKHRVSGKSVFKLEKIIKDKSRHEKS